MLVVGLLFALTAATVNSAAGLLEAAGSRRAQGGAKVVSQPLYIVGLAVDFLGFVLTVVALRYVAVFAVQAVLASSIAMTALAASRLYGTRLRVADRVALAGCVIGLATVAASAGSGGGPQSVSKDVGLIFVVGVIVLAAAAVPVLRSRGAVPAAVLAGLAFGGVALAVRAVHLRTNVVEDLRTLPGEPAAYAILGFAAIGIVSYTWALARADVATVTGVLVVTEAVVPGLIGIALLGDAVREGWQVPFTLGLLVAVVGVLALARSPTQRPPAARAQPTIHPTKPRADEAR